MPVSDSRHTSAELSDLINFSESLNLSREQRLRLDAIVQRLNDTIRIRQLSISYFRKSFEELNHLVKKLFFDLEATKLERDRYMFASENPNKSDGSN